MPSLQETVYTRLSGDATLSQLVGDRIYPTAPSEDVEQLPFVVYNLSSRETLLNLSGPSALTKYGLDVDCWADTLAEVVAVHAAVEALLHGWIDAPIQLSYLTNTATMPEDPGYHGVQSFSIWTTS